MAVAIGVDGVEGRGFPARTGLLSTAGLAGRLAPGARGVELGAADATVAVGVHARNAVVQIVAAVEGVAPVVPRAFGRRGPGRVGRGGRGVRRRLCQREARDAEGRYGQCDGEGQGGELHADLLGAGSRMLQMVP